MTKRIMSWILKGLHVNQSSGKYFNVDESDFNNFAEFLDQELMINASNHSGRKSGISNKVLI